MRSKLLNSNIIFSILMASAMVVDPFAVYADANINGQDDAAFTCSSAINVMDCINQTQNPAVQQQSVGNLKTAIPVSNQTFGFSGPVSFNVRYDQDLSWILDAGYAQSFGNRAAIALKASAGQNELRGNGTIGFAITPKQQIKITYEYLTQNLPFDYAAGTVNEWVSQNAYGAAYRYMVGNSLLQGIELSGSYTQANSKELSDIDMHDADGNYTGTDQRRIAGGQQKSGLASVILTPFKNTILKVGAGYSASSFDTKWSSDQAQSTIAYAVEATHLLTPKTLISTSVNNTSTNRAHTLKVSRILPGNIEGNITGQYNVSHVEGIENNASVTAGLSYPAPKTYSNMFAGGIGDLKSWVQQPVIYNARVLAIAEERILKAGIGLKAAIPNSPMPVNDSFEKLYTIKTDDYFSYDKQVYSSMNYKITTYQADGKTLADLKLQMSPLDSYNFQITSSAPMPLNMLTNGATTIKYLAVITAEGQRGGQTVTTVNSSPFEVDVTQNSGMPSATWIANTTLTGAVAGGSDYKSGPLANYVKGLDGEQFTFKVVAGTQNPAPPANDADSYTLKISDDGKYLTAKKIAANFSATTIQLTATSLASNNSVVIPNTQTGQQTFTIPLASAMTPPKVVSGVSLPDAVIGLPYGKTGDISNSMATLLNPSVNQMKYLTKIYNGVTYIDDSLTFTRLHQGVDCAWLDFDQNSGKDANFGDYGNLYSTKVTPPSSGTTCDLAFRVDGQQTKTSTTLTMKVNVRNQKYIAPRWTDLNLDPVAKAKSGSPLSVTLNPYAATATSSQFLTYTSNDDTKNDVLPTDGTETLKTFKLNSVSCKAGSATVDSSWLKITDDGILQSQDSTGKSVVIPNSVPANTTCSFKMTFVSTLAGAGPTNADEPKSFSINGTSPTWSQNTVSQEMPYQDLAVPGIKLSDNVSIPDDQKNNSDAYLKLISYKYTKSKDLPSGTSAIPDPQTPSYTRLDDGTAYLNVTPTPKDIVAKGWVSDPTNPYDSSYGAITAQAIYTADGSSSPASSSATFNVRVTMDLTNPTPNGTPLPDAVVNADYTNTDKSSVQLDPFKSQLYMNKTKYTDIHGNLQDLPDDKLDFSGTTSTYPDGSACWALVNKDTGVVSGKPTTDVRTCTLNVNVKSARNKNSSTSFSLPINVAGSAPVWDSNKTTPQTVSFDNTKGTDINLSGMMAEGVLPQNLKFEFVSADSSDPTISSDGRWKISADTSGGPIYLRRYKNPNTNTIDATDVGTSPQTVVIRATNIKGANANDQSLKVTVTPSDKATLYWIGNKDLNSHSQTSFDLNASIGTKLTDGTLVKDSITMNTLVPNNTATVTPAGAIQVSAEGNKYSLIIPAAVASDAGSFGVYPNTLMDDASSHIYLNNVTSQAMGKAGATYDLKDWGVRIIVAGQLAWKSNSGTSISGTIKFDAIDPGKFAEPNSSINLNQFFASKPEKANFTNFKFTFSSKGDEVNQSGYWKIMSPDFKNWYLIRATLNSSIDAGSVGKSEDLPTIYAIDAEDGMTMSAGNGGAAIMNPDPDGVSLQWFVPGSTQKWTDKMYIMTQGTRGQITPYFAGPSSSVNSKGVMQLKACLNSDMCETDITGDLIYSKGFGYVANGSTTCKDFDGQIHFQSEQSKDGVNQDAKLVIYQDKINPTTFTNCQNQKLGPANIVIGGNLGIYARSQGISKQNTTATVLTIMECTTPDKNTGCQTGG